MRGSLQSYADGELSERRHAAVEHHVGRCPECAAALSRLAANDDRFRAGRLEPAALSPLAARALMERALAEAANSRRTVRIGTFSSWGMAAALPLAAGALIAWRTASPPPQTPLPQGKTLLAQSPPAAVTGATATAPAPLRPAVEKHPASRTASTSNRGHLPHRSTGADHSRRKPRPADLPPHAVQPPPAPHPPRDRRPRFRFAKNVSSDTAPDDAARVSRSQAEACAAPEEAPADLIWARAADTTGPVPVQLVSGPAPEPGAAASEAPDAPPPVDGGTAAPALLVVVTDEPAPPAVTVTEAPETGTGFARASALQPDEDGAWTWIQSTISTECSSPERSLVMLGGVTLPAEEDADSASLGKEGDPNDRLENDPAGSTPDRPGGEPDGSAAPRS